MLDAKRLPDANQHHASADQDYAEIRKLEARRSEHGKKVMYNVHKKYLRAGGATGPRNASPSLTYRHHR
jgi:hypothetical protein